MNSQSETQPSNFRGDIQGLRAFAVIVVIADHILGWPKGGFVGVDVFFVISGFLITGLLIREYTNAGSISFGNFYERRIKRIIPASILVLAFTVAFTFPLWGLERTKLVIKDAIASSIFLGNWQFARNGVDYFQQDLPPSPLQHYWSLSVEEQFYFVWPWLLLLFMWLGTRFLRVERKHVGLVAGSTIAIISMASLIWAFHESLTSPTFAYFSTFSRIWELGIGALLAIGSTILAGSNERNAFILGILGSIGLFASLFLVDGSHGFPAPWALLPALSTAIVIAAGTMGTRARFLWNSSLGRYFGDISYSLYLWHFPVAVLLPSIIAKGNFIYYVVALSTTLILSIACYKWLEQPARRASWFVRNDTGRISGIRCGWLRYGSAVVIFFIISAAGRFLINSNLPPLAKIRPAVLASDVKSNPSDCFGAAALDPSHQCSSLNPENFISPRPADASRDQQGAYDCYINVGSPIRKCTYGSKSPDAKRIVLIGDSHAASMLPALKQQLEGLNWRLDIYVGNGCKWTDAPYREDFCGEVKRLVRELLMAEHYDLIIATGTRTAKASVEMHMDAMRPFVDKGQKIVVIDDNPSPSQESISCIQRVGFNFSRNCGTPKKFAYAVTDNMTVAAIKLGIPVVSQENFFCKGDQCQSAIGNVLVYKDGAGHVTASYSKTLGPYLVNSIKRAINGL